MDAEERFNLIKINTEEILGEDELKEILKKGGKLKHYIGFEISGKVHLGTGIVCMSKVKDFIDAGVDCSIFLADWHTWINDKLGGNPETIKKIAVGYFKEALKASLKCAGGNPEKLKFVLGSDLYHNNDLYWTTVIDISKNTSLSRILRSITIMGREEGESVDFAKLIYPPMQVADIFIQGINLAHGGLDQRKAQVIARDVALKLSFSPILNST
jgi:tyrosyl-tRNA synthetase